MEVTCPRTAALHQARAARAPRGSREEELGFSASTAGHANDCIRHSSINAELRLVIAPFPEKKKPPIFLLFYPPELLNHLEPKQQVTNCERGL